MKITKRLSIEFQHREVTISLAGSTLHFQDGEPDAANTPTVCPTCGSPWFTLFAPGVGDIPANLDPIRRALQQSGLHMQVSQAGMLNICQKSFEEIQSLEATKEKL